MDKEKEFASYLASKVSARTERKFSTKMIRDNISRINRLEVLFGTPIEVWGLDSENTKQSMRALKQKIKAIIYADDFDKQSKKHIAYGRAVFLYNEYANNERASNKAN